MEQLYCVKGELERGFEGKIDYLVSLDATYEAIEIDFSYSSNHLNTITPEIRETFVAQCQGRYGVETWSQEELDKRIQGMKTELQLLVMMDDVFLGGVHRGENPKHIHIDAHSATNGCIPCSAIQGALKISVLAFMVCDTNTSYTLRVSGKAVEN